MSAPKKPSIPSWQVQHQPSKNDTTKESSKPSAGADDQPSTDRQSLLDDASKFLEEESIRNAPIDRKIAFLESKGLTNDEIQKLLGVTRNPETNDSANTASTTLTEEKSMPAMSSKTSPLSGSPSTVSETPKTSAHDQRPSRDIPPIITYPEFLYEAQKPPPLVSLKSVLYTIYAASGIAASIYGASEFLVKPMVASLTTARHDFAETAQDNLEQLNKKLEENVSTIPPAASAKSHRSAAEDEEKDEDNAESVASDPTELFHRDIATQTSPEMETVPDLTSTADKGGPSKAEKAVAKHLKRLQNITSQLHEAKTAEARVDSATSEARDRLSELHTYLDSLTYSAPTYLNSNLYGMYGDVSKDSKKSGISSGEEDAIAAFKTEVRSVKGALLSAKNFPSGGVGYRFRSS